MKNLNDPSLNLLLRALVAAPVAWQTPAQLAARLDLDLDETIDSLAELDALGWLDPWELDDSHFVTLSPHAAERLAVRLVAIGRSESFRWVPIDTPDPPMPVSAGRDVGRMALLDLVADSAPGPEAIAEATECAERYAAAKAQTRDTSLLDLLPRPKILLGLGLTPWPGLHRDPMHSCPGCDSKPIGETSYCLVCDRWGLDHLLEAHAARTKSPRRETNPNPRRDPSHSASKPDPVTEAARAKAERKAKRQLKHLIKAEQERARRAMKANPPQPPDAPPPKPARSRAAR